MKVPFLDYKRIPSIQQTVFADQNKPDFRLSKRQLVSKCLYLIPIERQLVPKHRYFIPNERQLIPNRLYFIPSERQLIPKRRYFIPNERQLIPKRRYFIPSERQLVLKYQPFVYCCSRDEPHFEAFTLQQNRTHIPEYKSHASDKVIDVINPIVFILN